MGWKDTQAGKSQEQKINELALEYVRTDIPEKKENIKTRLYEIYLRFMLGLLSEAGDKIVQERMAQAESRREKSKFWGGYYDSTCFVSTMEACLAKYESEMGEFSHYFTVTYNFRLKSLNVEQGTDCTLQGVSISQHGMKRYRNFNKLLNKYALEDERFVGKRLEDLSRDEIRYVMQRNGLEGKFEEQYVELARLFADLKSPVDLSPVRKDEDAPFELQGAFDENSWSDPVKALEEKEWVKDFYCQIFAKVKSSQERFFRCFVLADMLNAGNKDLLGTIIGYWDVDFAIYLNKYRTERRPEEGNVTDTEIADYLKVTKGTVSKQRAAYKTLIQGIRGE